MTELYLGLIVLALITMLMWEKWENRKERARFTNALIAKTPEQFRDLELTDKVKPIIPPAQQPPDLIPESDLNDKEFEDLIKGVN